MPGGRVRCRRVRPRRRRCRAVEQPVLLEVGLAATLAREPEHCTRPRTTRRPPTRRRARTACSRRPIVRPGSRPAGGRHAAGPGEVIDLVLSLVGHPRRFHPPVDVLAAVVRGSRTCSPTASVTSRPLRGISSAIWMPEAEPPTTSTRPGRAAPGCGSRLGFSCWIAAAGGGDGGTCGSAAAPVASTTARTATVLVRLDVPAAVPAETRHRRAGAHRRVDRLPRSRTSIRRPRRQS